MSFEGDFLDGFCKIFIGSVGNNISHLLLGFMALNTGMIPVTVGVDFWSLLLSLSGDWLPLLLNFLLASSNLLKILLVGGFGQGASCLHCLRWVGVWDWSSTGVSWVALWVSVAVAVWTGGGLGLGALLGTALHWYCWGWG